MEKKGESGYCPREKWRLLNSLIKVSLLMILLNLPARGIAQEKLFTFELKQASVSAVFLHIEKNSDYSFVYNSQELQKMGLKDYNFKNATIRVIMENCLKGSDLSYEIRDKHVIVRRSNNKPEAREMVLVQGRVVGADKSALPGVTVLLKGTSTGVTTNVDGNYSIFVPKQGNPVLIFSFIGMKGQEVKCTGKSEINVVMEEDVKAMEEVIVTGYQRIRKSDMVGSTNSVKREDLFFDGTNSIEQMLQGKLPGMLVMNTSGLVGKRQKVRVRGTSTLLGNQEPVWVVDGIIQEDPLPFKTRELDALGNISSDNFDMVKDFVGNAISWLNPNDIQDITVLKDASATVMYGVKAANGVIVITTKRGKAGSLSVNYSGGLSFTPRLTYEKMNLMNSKERVDVSREIYERGLTSHNRPLETIGYEGLLGRYLNKEISYDEFDQGVKKLESTNTDWFDILFRNTMSTNHSLSLSGGSDRISYYGSVNAVFNNGTSKGNDATTYSASVGLDVKVSEKITASLRLNGATGETNAYYTVDPYGYATETNRSISCFTDDGKYFFYPKTEKGKLYNILHEIDHSGNTNTKRDMGVNVSLRWMILEGMQFESVFGLNTSNTTGESYADEQTYTITMLRGYEFGTQRPSDDLYKTSQIPHGGILNTTEDRNLNYTWRNSISYSKMFAEKHRLSFMAGIECRSNEYDGVASTIYGYFPSRGKTVSLPPRVILNHSGENISNDIYNNFSTVLTDRKATYLGMYATLTYGFGERFVVTGSVRSDASNRFGQDEKNRFLPVWSVGGRWNVHNEPWMQNQRVVSDLNFRVSYGWQGNVAENFGPDLIAQYGSGDNFIDGGRTGEYLLFIKSLPYGNLRWEKTKTINLGTDFGLFQNKVTVTFEYYYKHTEDMIITKEVPFAYGVTSMPVNGGNMTNNGIDISVGCTPIRTNNFTWSLSMNTSKNFNEVESKIQENKSWNAATGGSLNKEGYPVSAFWAFDFTGLNPETGSPEFNLPSSKENLNVMYDATEFMKYMGTLEPEFQGGLSMSLRYKTLSLSTSFNLNIGGKKFLYTMFDDDYVTNSSPSAYMNLPKEMVKRWKKAGDEATTNIPSLPSKEVASIDLPNGYTEYPHRLYNFSDIRVVNASFLRCNNLSLGYTVPERWIKPIGLKNVSFTASMSNPFIIVSKEYKGMDPEVARGSQPISRNYSFGINISL